MRAAMEAYAARRRAETPPVAPAPSTARFGLEGPVAPRATGPAGTMPRTGPANFPMATDIATARFDPQPALAGIREVEEGAKRLQTTLKQDLSAPAAESMRTFTAALQAGVAAALATVVSAAAQMKASLSFTATPTIAPRLVPPANGGTAPASGGAAPARASATAAPAPKLQTAGLRQRGGNTFTGPIHVHGVRDVAGLHRGIEREADRKARDSRDNGLHDLGAVA